MAGNPVLGIAVQSNTLAACKMLYPGWAFGGPCISSGDWAIQYRLWRTSANHHLVGPTDLQLKIIGARSMLLMQFFYVASATEAALFIFFLRFILFGGNWACCKAAGLSLPHPFLPRRE